MQQKFKQIINRQFSFLRKESFILAVSGGVDSMVLLDLCKNENLQFTVAHCNYQLRGSASDLDEKLVIDYCEKNQIEYWTKQFEISKKEGSIQNEARNLRYDWFDELCQKSDCYYIMLAHHLNDQLETMLINLSRGTGISGMRGMLAIQGNRLRPLLEFTKSEIVDWAAQKNIQFRQDESNFENKYKRNLIRNEVIPELEKLHPEFWKNVNRSFSLLSSQEKELKRIASQEKQKHLNSATFGFEVTIEKLNEWQERSLLKYILEDFDLSNQQLDELIALQHLENGKFLVNHTWKFLKYGNAIQIEKIDNLSTNITIDSCGRISINGKDLSIEKTDFSGFLPNVLILDLEKVSFPMTIRNIKNGDRFQPFGMKGSKLVNDYLKDRKVSKIERNQTLIIEDKSGIIGIVGHTIDDSRKIKLTNQRKVLSVKINSK